MDLVLKVAQEMQMADFVVPRVYKDLHKAPQLAAALKDICRILLFTGRAPYILSAAHSQPADHGDRQIDFIPHGGADLYRTIGALLLLPQFRTHFPPLSIDSVDASFAAEPFDELGIAAPIHVVPLTRDGGIDLDHIAEEHIHLFRTGKVRFCLTCIGLVHKTLQRNGIPTMRIMHSRVVVRDALEKARLALNLSRAEALQVAACVLHLKKVSKRNKIMPLQTALLSAARKCAEMTDGRIVRQSGNEAVVLATRGALERSINAGLLPGDVLPEDISGLVAFGIGYGVTASIAEEQGRRAIDAATAGSGRLSGITPRQLKQRRIDDFRTAKRLKISPTTARRLIGVFSTLDPENFTAPELADAYRLSPRSARRLVALLREQKLVEESGIDKLDGPGRPMQAYRIAMSRLAEIK